jgi:hypothetical protein
MIMWIYYYLTVRSMGSPAFSYNYRIGNQMVAYEHSFILKYKSVFISFALHMITF